MGVNLRKAQTKYIMEKGHRETHPQNIQGVQKLTLPFWSFVVLKVNLPYALQHQNHNLLEETCIIFLIPNMYQLATS